MRKLPHFPYHPDPIATGSVKVSERSCDVCGEAAGYVYDGEIYNAGQGPAPVICPWCIADGRAAHALVASFVDDRFEGAEELEPPVIEEITRRTPGFATWQGTYWIAHCGDGARFLGRVGFPEVQQMSPDAGESVKASIRLFQYPEDEVNEVFKSLRRHGSPAAYLFRCRRCDAFAAYWDCD